MRIMSRSILVKALCLLCLSPAWGSSKPRLVVLTDIGGDPDDQQSMVRLMLYSNEFEIEGLIASASGTPGELGKAIVKPHLIREIVEAYGKVRKNLLLHEPDYPAVEKLLACIQSGNPRRGLQHIGEGHNTVGSDWIVSVVDKPDPRPVNIAIWGGQTDLAQALWRVRHDRSPQDAKRFLAKLRIYDIADQDGIYHWIRENFPSLFYVLNHRLPGRDKRTAAFRGMYLGGDESLTSRDWIKQHVYGHGPLGDLYPEKTWTAPNPHGALKEGDTPSWFYFLPNGLNRPEHPEWGGWGGRFQVDSLNWFRDTTDHLDTLPQTAWTWDKDQPFRNSRLTVYRWRCNFQRDFQARLDWCVLPHAQANHAPTASVSSVPRRPLHMGDRIALRALDVSDPDGDACSFQWMLYPEAGTCQADMRLTGSNTERVGVKVVSVSKPGTAHLILKVTDKGIPPLCCYRRVVLEVLEIQTHQSLKER